MTILHRKGKIEGKKGGIKGKHREKKK